MGIRDRRNGPTMAHATYKADRGPAPSRERQVEYKRLNDRIHATYVDKLDGLVDTAFFEKMSNQWREEQNRCQREIEHHQNADESYLEEGVQLLKLARNAQRLFAQQEPREKRRLLNFVLSNCAWEGGEVVATFREPFDMLAETATNSTRLGKGETFKSAKNEIWPDNRDSNPQPRLGEGCASGRLRRRGAILQGR
jgi:site-specific DNA recombinase